MDVERIGPMNSLKTPKPLLAARMAFPLAASLITVLLGEWIARGALTADTAVTIVKGKAFEVASSF